jgi:AcrR family transcriptional regulator
MGALVERHEGRVVEQKRERVREQILEAARAALVRIGYERITTRRIAEEASVNVATLHYYFGTKEALLAETVRFTLQRSVARLRAAIEEASTATEALERAFDTAWQLIQERTGVLRYDLVVRGLRDDEARREASGIYASYRAVVEEILERHLCAGGTLAPGMTRENLAHYVIAAIDGVVLQYLITGNAAATVTGLALIRQQTLTLMGAGGAEGK